MNAFNIEHRYDIKSITFKFQLSPKITQKQCVTTIQLAKYFGNANIKRQATELQPVQWSTIWNHSLVPNKEVAE